MYLKELSFNNLIYVTCYIYKNFNLGKILVFIKIKSYKISCSVRKLYEILFMKYEIF